MMTALDIVNAAIQYIGDDQPPVTGSYPTFDDSAAGIAAAALYGSCVSTVARQFGWDFGRNQVALATSGNAAPLGCAYEYLYPSLAVEVQQIVPPAIADPNNPLPQNWSVGSALVSGVPTKVIWSNEQAALAVFTNPQLSNPTVWDPLFREAVVRLLGSEMAIAVAGKPDTSRDLLESASGFGNAGMTRPN